MSRTFKDRSHFMRELDHFGVYARGRVFYAKLGDNEVGRDVLDMISLVSSGDVEILKGEQARQAAYEMFRSSHKMKFKDIDSGYVGFTNGREVVVVEQPEHHKKHKKDNSVENFSHFAALNFRDYLDDETK